MSIAFTDIHNSSKLWDKHGQKMYKALDVHDKIIRRLVKKHGGFIVKNIGDSFMIKFRYWDDSIRFAVETQRTFPIPVSGNDMIELRIGIAVGKMNKKTIEIQNCRMVDYFGTTVNIASRMESVVSDIGGFAVYFEDPRMDEFDIMDVVKDVDVVKVKFQNTCPSDKRLKMLPYECRLARELKGVGRLSAYSVRVIKN